MDFSIIIPATTALVISLIGAPLLIKISKKKGFYAALNHRSSHDSSVPNTGGIVLGFAIIIPLLFFSNYPNQENFSLLISAFAVLLITGIIDDFNPIPVAYKFLGQFIPAIVIVTSIDEQELVIPFVNDFIQLPFIFNYLFWIFFIVLSINAFNLIDGIDGLAIGLGIVGSFFYFLKFVNAGEVNLSIFSISLCCGLFGLLFYNFSKGNKIFLGDTGSLLIGGLLIFFALKFISLAERDSQNTSFILVLGSIFIPLADIIRVTLVRVKNGDSPFKADRQHIHHLILDLMKGNHFLTTGILILTQIGVLFLFQTFVELSEWMYIIYTVITFTSYFLLATSLKKIRDKRI